MSATATAPAPGWYPDPTQPQDHLRWWDGSGWTGYTTDVPDPESAPQAPHPFTDIVVDIAPTDDVPDEDFDDDTDYASDAEPEPLTVAWSVPELQLAPREERGSFAFRARALEEPVAPVAFQIPSLPAYESPLAVVSSPLPARLEPPVVRLEPLPVAELVAEPEPEPEPEAPRPGMSRRRVAIAGTGTVVAVAAIAAGVTNLLVGHAAKPTAKAGPGFASIGAADKACLRDWNTSVGGAAQLRVTLGQFEGALARVGRVNPLPGTIMSPDSCALTVYDPATDTHAVFVNGVKGQDGYLDVTSYPRAKTYGWPKSARQANVSISPDGSIRAL